MLHDEGLGAETEGLLGEGRFVLHGEHDDRRVG